MDTCHAALGNLERVLSNMAGGGARSPFQWLFDIEKIKADLMARYKTCSKLYGHSGSLDDAVPELESLRMAIMRLSVLTIFGGFGVTFSVVLNTVNEAANDLKDYIRLQS